MATTMTNRIELQSAFVLHTRIYRETSLLVDALTQDEGRVSLVVKGARRPKSPYAGLLQPFVPLSISYLGRGDLKTLTQAEPQGQFITLTGEKLVSGLYLNELLVRLLIAHYPVPELFTQYGETVEGLASDSVVTPRLRLFEKQLLSTLGHDLCLHQDSEQQPIESTALYLYDPDRGPIRVNPVPGLGQTFSGQVFLNLGSGDLSDPALCLEAKKLIQPLISRLLGGKEIMARKLL